MTIKPLNEDEFKRTRLFVGGCADGRRLEIPPGDYPFYRAVKESKPINTTYDIPTFAEGYPCGFDTYRRDRLISGRDEYEFYVWEKIDPSQAVFRLLKKYKRP